MARSKKKERVPFTEEEKKQLLKASSPTELRALALVMHRSYDSLRRKKWALENRERDIHAHNEYRKERNLMSGKLHDYTIWSMAEEAYILNSDLPDVEIAKKLNRTISSVQNKRMRLLKNDTKGTSTTNKKGVRRNHKQS